MVTMPADTTGSGAGMEPPELVLDNLCKSFDGHVAVDRCSLALRRGEIVALLGASGCGKSTLLNMIAGFETPDYGTISLRGKAITGIAPHKRNVAMVFQHYAMFPHMTVTDNIAYGLHARRLDKAEIRARVAEMVALLHLGGLETRFPAQLSGGQRQRVAVARALAVRPDMLLLDEAFSALDRNLREDMQLELSLLLRRLRVTTVLVTHDQREAFALADRIAIMQGGRIAQIGTPEEVYRAPQSSSVLRFLGTTNRLAGVLVAEGAGHRMRVPPALDFIAPEETVAGSGAGPVSLDLRAEDIALSPTPTPVHPTAPGIVTLRTFLGAQERVIVFLGDAQIVVDRPAQAGVQQLAVRVGDAVYLDFDPAACRLGAAG
ncbi:ABC transporter ATP-binding protein [Xanthobacter dioxanivorans]|nr:ABC transporter ATP-binding protein [Xanthobacter dioxanivorans]